MDCVNNVEIEKDSPSSSNLSTVIDEYSPEENFDFFVNLFANYENIRANYCSMDEELIDRFEKCLERYNRLGQRSAQGRQQLEKLSDEEISLQQKITETQALAQSRQVEIDELEITKKNFSQETNSKREKVKKILEGVIKLKPEVDHLINLSTVRASSEDWKTFSIVMKDGRTHKNKLLRPDQLARLQKFRSATERFFNETEQLLDKHKREQDDNLKLTEMWIRSVAQIKQHLELNARVTPIATTLSTTLTQSQNVPGSNGNVDDEVQILSPEVDKQLEVASASTCRRQKRTSISNRNDSLAPASQIPEQKEPAFTQPYRKRACIFNRSGFSAQLVPEQEEVDSLFLDVSSEDEDNDLLMMSPPSWRWQSQASSPEKHEAGSGPSPCMGLESEGRGHGQKYWCTCGKHFGRNSALQQHLQLHVQDICKSNRTTLQCPDCPRTYKRPTFLIRHMEKEHGFVNHSASQSQNDNEVSGAESGFSSTPTTPVTKLFEYGDRNT